MTDQNIQNSQDPQDELNSLIQQVDKINTERKEDNSKLLDRLNTLNKEVDELSKKTDEAVVELTQAEVDAGDELDALILEEAENQDLEEGEDIVSEED